MLGLEWDTYSQPPSLSGAMEVAEELARPAVAEEFLRPDKRVRFADDVQSPATSLASSVYYDESVAPATLAPAAFALPDGHQMMKAIAARGTSALLSSTAGAPLTETNLNKFNKALQALGTAAIEGEPKEIATDPLAGLTGAALKRAQALQEAVDSEGFEARSYLANVFRNDHKPGTPAGTKYKECTNRDEAKTFRMEWTKKQLNNITTKKVHSTSWKRIDKTLGKYRNFGRLVIDLGGWTCQEAIDGATCAITKCVMMGSPWVRRHPQTLLVEYLVLEMQFEEVFENMWSDFEEQWHHTKVEDNGKPAALATATAAASSAGEAVTPPEPEKQPKKAAKPQKKARKEDDAAEPNSEDKKRDLSNLIREAGKVKVLFHSVTSNYAAITTAVRDVPAWSWFKGGTKEAELSAIKEKLQQCISDWHREYLCTSDVAGLRRKYTPERMAAELTTFMECKIAIDKLSAKITAVRSSHDLLNT